MREATHIISDMSGGLNRYDKMPDVPVNEAIRLHNQFPGLRIGVGARVGNRGSPMPFPGCDYVPIHGGALEIAKTPTSLCLVRLGARRFEDYSGSLDYLIYLVSDENQTTYFLLKTLFRSTISEPDPEIAGWGRRRHGTVILPDYRELHFLGKDKAKARIGEWGGAVVNADSMGSMVVFAKDGLWVWPGAIGGETPDGDLFCEKFFNAEMSPGTLGGRWRVQRTGEDYEGFTQGDVIKWLVTATVPEGWEFGTGVSNVLGGDSSPCPTDGWIMEIDFTANTDLDEYGFNRLDIWGTQPGGYVYYHVETIEFDFSVSPRQPAIYVDGNIRHLGKPLNRPLLPIPEANLLKFYNRILFIAGVKDHPNISYYSTIGQDGVPQPFSFHGMGDVSDFESELLHNFLDWQDDGDKLTALQLGQPYIYFFKNNCIGWTRGGGARELAMAQEIFLRGKGTPSQQAVTGDYQNIFFYCASDRKVYHLRGRTVTDISWIVDKDWQHLMYHPNGLEQTDVFLHLYGNLLYLQFPEFKGTDNVEYPAFSYVCDVDSVLAGKRPWWTQFDRRHHLLPMIDHNLIAPTGDVPSFFFVGQMGERDARWPFYTNPAVGSWDKTTEDHVAVQRRTAFSHFDVPHRFKRIKNIRFNAYMEKN